MAQTSARVAVSKRTISEEPTMDKKIEEDFETSTIERERWKAAILSALQAMRRASETGLCRHLASREGQERSSSIPPLASRPPVSVR